MKILIVGLGVQGKKRIKYLKKKHSYVTVDTKNSRAEYNNIRKVPLNKYDTVFVCTPDDQKNRIINYCIKNKKNILVEKPLFFKKNYKIKNIEIEANKNKVKIYTAYNHRFEPHFINIKKIIKNKALGKIYYCNIYYGNGTAKLVKKEKWRDQGLGVIKDIGSHLIDTIYFWFEKKFDFKLITKCKFENKSPDHAILISRKKKPLIKLEMSMCRWKNSLNVEIIGSKGSLKLDSLCKWGPSILTLYKRKLPSGLPSEKKFIIKKKDPTWELEHKFFEKLIKIKKNNLNKDLYISKVLKKL